MVCADRLLGLVWQELKAILEPIVANKSEQERRIELITKGSIEMWSLDSMDTARGRGYALVVLDEAAMAPNLETVWTAAIRPMLTDEQGDAWFLSTPKGMNYFKTLFDRGQDPANREWASWQMPTSENPIHSIGKSTRRGWT